MSELPAPPPRRALATLVWLSVTTLAVAGSVWFAGTVGELAQWRGPGGASESSANQVDVLPTVRASDVTLTRARSLFETGHAGDAVRLLATIPLADVNRAEADRVLADIQRALLTSADPSSADTVSPVR